MPTGDTTADFYAEPLRGAMFRHFRDMIMGVASRPDLGPGKKAERKNEFGRERLEVHGVHRSALEFQIFESSPGGVPELDPESS